MLKSAETIWLTELNQSQMKDVWQLLAECNQADKGTPLIYPSSLLGTRLPPVNGLIYYQQKLIAFVSAYFFYKKACECSLMVSPKYRRRGLARQLLDKLLPILKSQNMDSVYFSASEAFPADAYPQLQLHGCEYQLGRSLKVPIAVMPYDLSFREATIDDIEAICALDEACFGSHDRSLMTHRMAEVIQSSQYHLILGELAGAVIAKAHIQWQKQQAIISDIAVLPQHQKKGYGSQIIHACLSACQQRAFEWVKLDVESQNKRALKLYFNHGFETLKATNLWAMSLK